MAMERLRSGAGENSRNAFGEVYEAMRNGVGGV